MLTAFAVLLCLTAALAYLNERFFHFPTTVGVTLSGALAGISWRCWTRWRCRASVTGPA